MSLFSLIEWDEPDMKSFYSGEKSTCKYHAVWHGRSPEINKWSLYKRAPCGRFGVHANPERKRYASLEDVEAAALALSGGLL